MAKRLGLTIETIPLHTDDTEVVELPLSGRAFWFLGGLLLVAILIVFSRMMYLGVAQAAFYSDRSAANVHKEVIIPAPRGIITDRYGEPLVRNRNASSVWIDASKLLKDPTVYSSVLDSLAATLAISRDDIEARVRATNILRSPVIRIAEDIPHPAVIELKSADLPEVDVTDDYVRDYIGGPVFAHVIGYREEAGVEGYYNDILKGEPGRRIVYRDAAGEAIQEKILTKPTPGLPLVLTIDASLQKFFHKRLQEGLAALGRDAGVGIALQPQTGEVLALVSLPSFDNNNVKEYLGKPGQPLFNRATSGVYNPGSTIKPLVALAALKERIIDPTAAIYSSGVLEIPNPYFPDQPSRFLDWRAHGFVNLREALARSSNVYFYQVGGGYPVAPDARTGLGIERLRKYWDFFGFGKPTGIDIVSEASGFLPNPEEKEERTGQIWRLGDTYNVSIGQGDLLVTPIQLINFIASIGNNGYLYEPHLILRDGEEPRALLDYSAWTKELSEVRQGMEDAVLKNYGTANLLSLLPISAAGKTGSAQAANNTRTNAFFAGYAPAEKPEIAVLVLVENAKEGSLNAVPIAKDVILWYFQNRMSGKSKNFLQTSDE